MISIIIPTFNRSDLLPETLNSILLQSDDNWECLLIDDGSSDETWSILEEFASKDQRFQIYKRSEFSKPKGANACRNIGIEKSKGEYLLFFDSDDWMNEDCISEHEKMIINSKSDLNILPSIYYDPETSETSDVIKGNIYSPDLIEKFFQKDVIWITHNPTISKSFLLQNQIDFDENLQAGQDWAFFMRILLYFPKVDFSNYVAVKMRVHENTISKDSDGKARKYFHYYKARHLIFNQFLNDVQRSNLEAYYKNYAENMLRELIKMKKYDWAKEIIENETKGTQLISNLGFLQLYKTTKKGLSKITLS